MLAFGAAIFCDPSCNNDAAGPVWEAVRHWRGPAFVESNGRSYKGDRKTALVIPGSCVADASQDCEDASNGLFEILRMAAFGRRTVLAAFTVSGLFELTAEGAIL